MPPSGPTYPIQLIAVPRNGRVTVAPVVVVSWAVTCETYVLEQTASLTPTVQWQPATGQLSVVSGRYRLTRPNTGTLFYRLRRDRKSVV